MWPSTANRYDQASVAADGVGITPSGRRLAHPAARRQPALLVGEVAPRILRPRVAVHLQGAHAEAAAADVLPLAGPAAALEQGRPVAQAGEQRIGEVLPDLAERPLLHVAQRVLHPELVRVHVAQEVDVGEADARAV